jgi:pimeloyl-ACP methyl ester carboxylesterase
LPYLAVSVSIYHGSTSDNLRILFIRRSGHSFGGYLTAAYALKHPERLKSAILADPWGMAPRPADIKERFNVPFWVGIIFRNCTPSKPGIFEATHFLGFLLCYFDRSKHFEICAI